MLKPTDVDNHNYVAVINAATADDLIGTTDCLGDTITLNGTKFTVVGVLEDSYASLSSMFSSGTMVAYVPYTTAQRLSSAVTSAITSFSQIR